ncbi:MAG: phosphatase PAP2 family protein [Candidatus Paceibacterota bacterium]|jgi:undecaprenyl-diphosphatase
MNNTIFFFFYNLAHQSAFFDKLIIFLGYIFPILLLFGIGIFVLFESNVFNKEDSFSTRFKKLFLKSIIICGPAITAYLIGTLLKEIIHLDRSFIQFNEIKPLFNPTQEYSFPSSHATTFSAFALSMYFYNKKIGVFLLFSALLIGIMRVIAGVHFPLDILGGFLLGFAISYIFNYLFRKYKYI